MAKELTVWLFSHFPRQSYIGQPQINVQVACNRERCQPSKAKSMFLWMIPYDALVSSTRSNEIFQLWVFSSFSLFLNKSPAVRVLVTLFSTHVVGSAGSAGSTGSGSKKKSVTSILRSKHIEFFFLRRHQIWLDFTSISITFWQKNEEFNRIFRNCAWINIRKNDKNQWVLTRCYNSFWTQKISVLHIPFICHVKALDWSNTSFFVQFNTFILENQPKFGESHGKCAVCGIRSSIDLLETTRFHFSYIAWNVCGATCWFIWCIT